MIYTTDWMDPTTARSAECRYCQRYRRACGRAHTEETRADWGRSWDGQEAPGADLRHVPLVADLQVGLASHPLTAGLTVRQTADLAAHLAKALRDGVAR